MNGLRSLLAATLLVAMGASTALAQENGAFDVELAIDPTGSVDPRVGLVVITGTLTCSEPAAFADVFVELVQPIGRRDSVQSFGFSSAECDVTPTPFEVTLFAFEGRFGPGTAIVNASAGACADPNFEDCAGDQVTTIVRLRAQRLG